MSERESLKSKRADKRRRLEDILRPRVNGLLAEVRRHLGGQYVETLDDIRLAEATAAFTDLKRAVREARKLEEQIDHNTHLLES